MLSYNCNVLCNLSSMNVDLNNRNETNSLLLSQYENISSDEEETASCFQNMYKAKISKISINRQIL